MNVDAIDEPARQVRGRLELDVRTAAPPAIGRWRHFANGYGTGQVRRDGRLPVSGAKAPDADTRSVSVGLERRWGVAPTSVLTAQALLALSA